MENHKHDHPNNHTHKHDAGAAAAGHHEHKHPAADSGADDAVDLDNLTAAAQKAGHADAKLKGPEAEVLKQEKEIDELKSKIEASNDKYLRLMAEFDNFKRRTAKEYQQLIEQANEKLIQDIIEVRENFERAFKHHKEGADLPAFFEGMKMIFAKLDTVLHKHGLEVYCEAGQEFDPGLHDAMMKTAHDTIPEEHIAEVCEKGYKLKGKVIKHSRVVVSSGKPSADAPKAEGKKNACTPADEEAVIEVAVEPDTQEKTDTEN
jgi:molecular chaperone GrpE